QLRRHGHAGRDPPLGQPRRAPVPGRRAPGDLAVAAERSQFALQVRIGAFILSALVVFVAIIYLLGAQARYFERKDDLTVEFVEVGGLIEGATVRLAGVQIGRVTAVTLPEQPGRKARGDLTI